MEEGQNEEEKDEETEKENEKEEVVVEDGWLFILVCGCNKMSCLQSIGIGAERKKSFGDISSQTERHSRRTRRDTHRNRLDT